MTTHMTLPLQEESISTTDTIDLAVREVRPVAEDCIVMVLETADGAELPEWSPGAHIDLILGDDLVRQYSLCGDPPTAPAGASGSCASRRAAAAPSSSTTRCAQAPR